VLVLILEENRETRAAYAGAAKDAHENNVFASESDTAFQPRGFSLV